MTTPTPELLQAFKETDYTVHSEPPFAMRIGQACPELMTLMAQHKAQCAAFITACNPCTNSMRSCGWVAMGWRSWCGLKTDSTNRGQFFQP
jgi:hypothetical protein